MSSNDYLKNLVSKNYVEEISSEKWGILVQIKMIQINA
jgi:hypothetical protein